MPIQLQDNILTEAPKPTDEKMFFGSSSDLLYENKEDIPAQYRFIGMVAYDVNSPYTVWQLQGSILDVAWTDITGGTSSVPDVVITSGGLSNGVDDQKVFTLPGGLDPTNCKIDVNGINETQYTLVDNGGTSTLTFVYGLEPMDAITWTKFENIV